MKSKEAQKGEESKKTVLITNLAFRVTDDILRDYCTKAFGTVGKLTLVKDDHGRSKGFAFVLFENEEAVEKAYKLSQFDLCGRVAYIKRSQREFT